MWCREIKIPRLLLSYCFPGFKNFAELHYFSKQFIKQSFCERYNKTNKITCSVESQNSETSSKKCPVYEKKLDIPEMLFQEVHPDCFLVSFGECAPTVTLDQTRLSHGTISHNHNLKNHKKQLINDDMEGCTVSVQCVKW